MDGIGNTKAPRCDHGFTAAATAIADEIDAFSDVFAELNQLILIGLVQEFMA